MGDAQADSAGPAGDDRDGVLGVHCNLLFLCMGNVSIDTVFFKNEFSRMSVSVLRTIDLDALQIFKAVVTSAE